MICFALLLYPSLKLWTVASAGVVPLEEDLRMTQAELASFREVSQERQSLQAQYDELIRQTLQIQADYQSATIQWVSWGSTLKTIVGAQPIAVFRTVLDSIVRAKSGTP